MPVLTPSGRAEEIALFRHQLIAPLVLSDTSHGELRARLVEISQQRVRPPRADATRTYSIATLERWYYAFRQHGLEALRPSPRGDRGRARDLTTDQRALLLDIRREHPNASAALILRTLVADGRLTKGAVSVVTLRRLYREHRLDRAT
ncbi:MAG: helix-turn-helix domain-containing protein, partial [Accumulibacter sp.]|uniref:helix-turn-helix domain-containing protein n=1 Tax=Accumulibacter sp. TaxID=2053492 RepID=UPI00331538DC